MGKCFKTYVATYSASQVCMDSRLRRRMGKLCMFANIDNCLWYHQRYKELPDNDLILHCIQKLFQLTKTSPYIHRRTVGKLGQFVFLHPICPARNLIPLKILQGFVARKWSQRIFIRYNTNQIDKWVRKHTLFVGVSL